MHEYHKAIHIIEHAIEDAHNQGKSKVTKINLVVGESSGFSPETIQLHFLDVSLGTICEGAEISVRKVKTMLKCPKCCELFVRKPFEFSCPHCNVDGIPSEVGREMSIESIEAE
ncbi:MAG: hydrogenase maturation nickel metallochaperone HypA [Oscillospiraceae bacterium]